MGRIKHNLEIEYRGDVHVHRWKPVCICGWIGVPRRRRKEAVKQYEQHTRSGESVHLHNKRHTRLQPRPLTPESDLPEALRPRQSKECA